MSLLLPAAKEALLRGELNLLHDELRLLCVDTELYRFDPSHQLLSDVPRRARLALSAPLTNRTVDAGTFRAAPLTLDEFPDAAALIGGLYLISRSDDASWRLLVWIDAAVGRPGLPLRPNGGVLYLAWSDDGIFAL